MLSTRRTLLSPQLSHPSTFLPRFTVFFGWGGPMVYPHLSPPTPTACCASASRGDPPACCSPPRPGANHHRFASRVSPRQLDDPRRRSERSWDTITCEPSGLDTHQNPRGSLNLEPWATSLPRYPQRSGREHASIATVFAPGARSDRNASIATVYGQRVYRSDQHCPASRDVRSPAVSGQQTGWTDRPQGPWDVSKPGNVPLALFWMPLFHHRDLGGLPHLATFRAAT